MAFDEIGTRIVWISIYVAVVYANTFVKLSNRYQGKMSNLKVRCTNTIVSMPLILNTNTNLFSRQKIIESEGAQRPVLCKEEYKFEQNKISEFSIF